MARRSVLLLAAGSGLLLVAGSAAIAAAARERRKNTPGNAEQSSDGAADQAKEAPGGPSEQAPFSEAELQQHQKGFAAASEQFRKLRSKQISEAEAIKNYKGTTNDPYQVALAAALSVASAAANSIPVAGQAVSAVLAITALIVKFLPAGAWIAEVGGRDFTGWRAGSYFYHDVPIYGPKAELMLNALPHEYLGDKGKSLEALRKLIERWPVGPDWPVEISVFATGNDDTYFDYFYLFNPGQPGNLSQTARSRHEVFGMNVYSTADITPTGPRGFDPAQPLAWKIPGQRASKYDQAIKLEPQPEAGL